MHHSEQMIIDASASIRHATFDDFVGESDPGDVQLLVVATPLEREGRDEGKGCLSDPEDIQDLVFFCVLLVIGLVLSIVTYGTSDFKALLAALLGENLFTAGMIPVLTVGYKLAIAQYQRDTSDFKEDNKKKVYTSLGFTIIGAIILAVDYSGNEFGVLIGSTFMLTGLVYIIERLFFVQEDTERKQQRTNDQLIESKKTLSTGLATGYFYNFVKPFCTDLYNHTDCPGKGKKDDIRIPMEFGGRGNQEERMLCGSKMVNILIPRDINTKDLKGTYKHDLEVGGLTRGHHPSTPWSMKVPFLKTWDSEGDDGFEAGQFCTYIGDVPNTLSTLYHRKADVQKRRNALPEEDRKNVPEFNMQHEIVTFTNTLMNLIEGEKECKALVRILSIPPIKSDGEIEWDVVRSAVALIEKDPDAVKDTVVKPTIK